MSLSFSLVPPTLYIISASALYICDWSVIPTLFDQFGVLSTLHLSVIGLAEE